MSEKKSTYIYVQSEAELKELISHIRAAERVAVDTESNSLYSYYDKVCLIQLAWDDQNYVVDPLLGMDLSKLLKILAEKPLILHAADNDLRILRTQFGFFPKRTVFDTMIAAKLSGHSQMGLAALVKKYFNVELPKKGQKANWARRPLTDVLLEYASNDTRYLAPLADRLFSELQTLGREEWYRESCERMIQSTTEDRKTSPDMQWRISGTGALKKRRQLAYVREIWKWRESEAQKVDKPPYMILGNNQILQLAEWASAQKKNLNTDQIPYLPKNCTGARLDNLKNALFKVRDMAEEKWPEFRKPKPYTGPDCKKESDELKEECFKIAQKLKLDPSILAPRATLALIARHHASDVKKMMACSPIMSWQAKILEPSAKKIFDAKGSA